jgi:hypothetical protein
MSTKEIHSEIPTNKIVARVSQDWLDGKNDEYLGSLSSQITRDTKKAKNWIGIDSGLL